MKTSYITLAVPRSFKNADGIYETDFIPVRLYKGIAENAVDYCKKGDLLGVKGRVQTKQEEDKTIIEIVADRGQKEKRLFYISSNTSNWKRL